MTQKRIHGPDPIATAYRNKGKPERVTEYDFVGMTGKMDDAVRDEVSPAHKKSEEKFKKLLTENYAVEQDKKNNDNDPQTMAERHASIDKNLTVGNGTGMNNQRKSNLISGALIPYKAKHQLATEHFHHDKAFDFKNNNVNDHKLDSDKMLEELTSKGHPSEALQGKMHSAIGAFKDTDPKYHEYLHHKYNFALHPEMKPFVHYKGEENALSKEEIMAHQGKYKFYTGRAMTKEGVPGHFQLHPNGDINRVPSLSAITGGHDSGHDSHPFHTEANRLGAHELATTLSNLHDKHVDHKSIGEYTKDSAVINKTLALQHEQQPLDTRHQNALEATNELSKNISDRLTSAPLHGQDFHVYTGMSRHSHMGANVLKAKGKPTMHGHFPAFTSTSLSPNIADTFARPKQDPDFHQDVSDVMHIHIPANYKKGAFVSGVSQQGREEQEYLLDKGHHFDVSTTPKHYAVAGKIHRMWEATPRK